MKSKTVRPPTPKAITLAIQHLQEQINKRLASKYLKASTKSSLLRNADTLCKMANKIYSALGVEACATSVDTKSTNARLDKIESVLVDISKQRIEHSERQLEKSTVKRTIIHEEITNTSEQESTTTMETETASYRSQFLKSFGNRIFEAHKQAEKDTTEFQCIKDLLRLLNSYVYNRFRKQSPQIGFYTYGIEQMEQFTTIIVLKYATEYSKSPYNAKVFAQEMQEWISKIGVDEQVTKNESLPKCLHKFSIEQDCNINKIVVYIWWLTVEELQNAKRTENETLDFDELFDYEFLDNLIEKINSDVYDDCTFPISRNEASKYLE